MNCLDINAYAKINIGLDVLRKREDGYHEVSMIMQSVELHDTLTLRKLKDGRIVVKTRFAILPEDGRNIVYRAAELFLSSLGLGEGVQIDLTKRIPIAAGMAGGSSDAAATLKGLNRLFETGLSDEELMNMGVKLGADVPYCIMLGTALSEGIGELLTPLKPLPSCHILLVKPDFSVSTKYVYENLRLSEQITHPDITGMLSALEKGDLHGLAQKMDNILQTVTMKEYPLLKEITRLMEAQGALVSLMSGSGPTVFGVFDNLAAAESSYRYFRKSPYGKTVELTKPYQP